MNLAKKYSDGMLDIETLATSPNAVVIQVGFVPFDISSGVVGKNKFLINISSEDCQKYGLETNPDTIAFWEKQDRAIWNSTQENPQPLEVALRELAAFIRQNLSSSRRRIWSHATFDIPVVSNAYNVAGIEIPWNYRETRDIRTLNWLHTSLLEKKEKENAPRENAHNALADCLYQIEYVCRLHSDLNSALTI